MPWRLGKVKVWWGDPPHAPHSLKPAVSAECWPLLGLHVLFSPCHHALFISLRPLSVTNAAMQQLACSTLRPRDLMSALSPAVYFQSWDTVYHFILRGHWMLESDWLTNIPRCAIIFRETHAYVCECRLQCLLPMYTEQNYKRNTIVFCPHFSWAELKDLFLKIWKLFQILTGFRTPLIQ